MENASKALIMAASVLLGVMILSIGAALYNSFSNFGADTTAKIQERQISEFNNNFLKYYGKVTVEENNKTVSETIKVTAHDIISVTNLAKKNNLQYEIEEDKKIAEQKHYNDNTYYIQVNFKNTQMETKDEKFFIDFLKNNSLKNEEEPIYFMCSEVHISDTTKRVTYITFDDYK